MSNKVTWFKTQFQLHLLYLGYVHKRRPQSKKWGGCSVRTFCRHGGRGFFRCGRPHFSVEKSRIFRN